MASACVNNIGVSSAAAAAASSYSSYGWLTPRLSFSRDNDKVNVDDNPSAAPSPPDLPDSPPDPADFEFRLAGHPADAMLPADELFSGGKLVPLHLSAIKPGPSGGGGDDDDDDGSSSPEKSSAAVKSRGRSEASVSGNDPYLFSPKAPRCSSRWRELLGLKKLYNSAAATGNGGNPSSKIGEGHKTTTSKSVKNFLHRSSKSYSDSSSLVQPLLSSKDSSSSSDSFESLYLSSRLSLSSSSSGHDHDDLPRHSLDFPDKPPAISLRRNTNRPAEGARAGRSPVRRRTAAAAASRGVSVDSPRMNSSGKIVFHSLERSSSSPSSFSHGGPRFKHHNHHRPMERSYSGGVRVVTPVLNVPVCSLRVGFGQLFSSPQKRSEPNNNRTKSTTRTTN